MSKLQHSHQYSNQSCIVENSMINGLQMNLKEAIEHAGATVSKNDCLWQYPDIIKNNLIAKSISNINIIGKDIITITPVQTANSLVYQISTIYDTENINRPNYADTNEQWGKELSIDSIFNDLFSNILPSVRGVHAGDITTTDKNGNDTKQWNNTLFNEIGNKTNLESNAKYLRLYLTCQAEPIYILIESAISNTTGGYNIQDSDSVYFNKDDNNMTLSAHILNITKEQIDSLQ